MQIMRFVLGETCIRFSAGSDGGRDGWFRGTPTGTLASPGQPPEAFIVQCKHTSVSNESLSPSDLAPEIPKVTRFARKTPCEYILITNKRLSGPSEEAIRLSFEAIEGVHGCRILPESWIESTIDANPRLLRLVPRLYGIGDLSQILSSTVQQQTLAILEDLGPSVRTFVPTNSYRQAEEVLHNHGFLVLVGPPASGKSAIASNLCLVGSAQNPDLQVLKIEHAEQFKSTWAPSDTQTVYWVDDVFGETTLDDDRLRDWSQALDKVEAARRRHARVIFCTRDYILAAAGRRIKRSKLGLINDARVRVDVTALTRSERESILYNHIKHGDIPRDQKRQLKPHLPRLAQLPSFSPELARRLGSRKLGVAGAHNWAGLKEFFDRPVEHFRDVIHGLSGSETAALAACLLSDNAAPDPIPDSESIAPVLAAYGVTSVAIRESLELLEGSLVRRGRRGTVQFWQLHHPSMVEALQQELSARSSQLLLYVQSAQLAAILRDTTTDSAQGDPRLIFLPTTVYPILLRRFDGCDGRLFEAVAHFLATRSSDDFLIAANASDSALLDRALSIVPDPDGDEAASLLAVRLTRVSRPPSLFSEERQQLLLAALRESVRDCGWAGFLQVDGLDGALPGFAEAFLRKEVIDGFRSLSRLGDWYKGDLSSESLIDSAQEGVESYASLLRGALTSSGLASEGIVKSLEQTKDEILDSLEETRTELEQEKVRRDDYYESDWKDRWYEERDQLQNGRFADVDE